MLNQFTHSNIEIMGAAASMQRPEIGHLSVQSALDQGYDMETIRLIKTQLEKNKDASDLQTRDF